MGVFRYNQEEDDRRFRQPPGVLYVGYISENRRDPSLSSAVLRLVHRGVRYRRSEGREGTARRAVLAAEVAGLSRIVCRCAARIGHNLR